MTKKTLLIILIVLLILILSGLFIILNKDGPQDNENGDSSGRFLSNLFPFGDDSGDNNDESRPEVNVNERNENLVSSNDNVNTLQQLTNLPIAGFVSSTTKSGSIVRYVDREIGNVYEIGESLSAVRITNTTVPSTYEAIIANSLSDIVYRYENDDGIVKTFLAAIDESTSTAKLDEPRAINNVPMVDGIFSVVPNYDNTKIIFVEPAVGGVKGKILDFSAGIEEIFDSPFREWILMWPNDRIIAATTKPSSFEPGYHYFINIENGSFNKVFDGINGLTVSTNPTGEFLIASGSTVGGFTSGLYNVANSVGTNMQIRTIADKCTWNPVYPEVAYCGSPIEPPRGEYPDDWYKGKVQFSDEIIEINVLNNITRTISVPENSVGIKIDVIDPKVSRDGSTLYFINKIDSTLWSLSLDRPVGVDKYDDEEVEEVDESKVES